jgi:membrane-associated PAP2 superfamily phosphatase
LQAWSGNKLRTLSLWLILAGVLIVGTVFAVYPELDVRMSSYFFDNVYNPFPLGDTPMAVSLRNLNSAIDILFGIALAGAMLLTYLRPARPPLMSRRTVIFLVVTFVLAPVLIANGIFKEHWSRPRPSHLIEYGSEATFVPWWDPGGTCQKSCSFFSGEVSAASWTMAPAVLVPGALGVVAIVASVAFTAVIAVVRMAQGAHFFSDAAFAALITWFIIWVAYGVCYLRPLRPQKSS